MDRAEYEASILARLDQAVRVPFRENPFKDWCPKPNDCHNNVDAWVVADPSCTAVRGWLIESTSSLTAHSVVRGVDGQLFDVTPFRDENLRLPFIEHEGDDASFDQMKAAGGKILGWTVDPDELAEYLRRTLDLETDAEVAPDDGEEWE